MNTLQATTGGDKLSQLMQGGQASDQIKPLGAGGIMGSGLCIGSVVIK